MGVRPSDTARSPAHALCVSSDTSLTGGNEARTRCRAGGQPRHPAPARNRPLRPETARASHGRMGVAGPLIRAGRRSMRQSSTACVHALCPEPPMRLLTPCTGPQLRLVRHPPPTLSRDATRRLAWFTYYATHGANASLTCRHFGISRATFYAWKARFAPRDLRTLETRSRRPHRGRARTWTVEQVAAV